MNGECTGNLKVDTPFKYLDAMEQNLCKEVPKENVAKEKLGIGRRACERELTAKEAAESSRFRAESKGRGRQPITGR